MKLEKMVRGPENKLRKDFNIKISSNGEQQSATQKVDQNIKHDRLPAVFKAEFDSGQRELRTV